jgi:hypothetical protein
VIENERQVFVVEHRIDVRNDLLAQPRFLFARNLQPILPFSGLDDGSCHDTVSEDEGATLEIEEMQLRLVFGENFARSDTRRGGNGDGNSLRLMESGGKRRFSRNLGCRSAFHTTPIKNKIPGPTMAKFAGPELWAVEAIGEPLHDACAIVVAPDVPGAAIAANPPLDIEIDWICARATDPKQFAKFELTQQIYVALCDIPADGYRGWEEIRRRREKASLAKAQSDQARKSARKQAVKQKLCCGGKSAVKDP